MCSKMFTRLLSPCRHEPLCMVEPDLQHIPKSMAMELQHLIRQANQLLARHETVLNPRKFVRTFSRLTHRIIEHERTLAHPMLTCDTRHKLELVRNTSLQQLWNLVEIEHNTSPRCITYTDIEDQLSHDLALQQLPSRQIETYHQLMSFFELDHPIYTMWLSLYKMPGVTDGDKLCVLEYNLLMMSDHSVYVETAYARLIDSFADNPNLYASFKDLRRGILALVARDYPDDDKLDIEQTVAYYQKLATYTRRHGRFIFKMLTTSAGVNFDEQYRYVNISHLQTTMAGLWGNGVENI